ncbi:MAG: DUF2791 family P-loop domain-containing protein [Gammaproteobacteria bacterium]|nr:DUF2791 family P-loop domain-containing protein [Gammaproteobacteria bacterium]
MSCSEYVSVNAHYTRSINLERDSGSVDVLAAYIPTSRAIRTLERIANSLNVEQAPRAWSLVGPYGSGKSSFSVFTSGLFGDPQSALSKMAHQKLKVVEPRLQKSLSDSFDGSRGMLEVLVTGSPEPMSKRILISIKVAMEDAWSGRRGKRPPFFHNLDQLIAQEEVNSSQILDFIKALQQGLEKIGYKGLLLIIDELGKFLEYEARHYGANDIYLLQLLAEHACSGGACNLYVFVMLHQSFEQYAKGLGENLKNEWSKVQGRFEEVPFIESSEQVLRIVSSAFVHNIPDKLAKPIDAKIARWVETLAEVQALPVSLKPNEAVQLFEACYPLHPVSALILPVLCQKIAQNERTLFSYLGSHEEFGLADMLSKLQPPDDFVQPHHIFDYFVSNQSAALSDYATHRRWAEVATAIERLGDAPEGDIELLKTIGILNILGSKGGLKASKLLLECCFAKKSAVKESLQRLKQQSIIAYRKFNGEYRVWQGSDFDLEEAVQEALDHIGEFELAEELNNRQALQPVVARRYTISNGALRYFSPLFVDARSYKATPVKGNFPRLILFVAGAQDDEKIFREHVAIHFSDLDIVAICKNGSYLRESTAEVLALKYVGESRQELNNDPVAKREFTDRLNAAEVTQASVLAELLERPEESSWYHKGKPLEVASKRGFQEQLSQVLSKVFNRAPELHNELVNRDKPSSQANAGRIKLLHAMLSFPGVADLGIDKFPPEKAIYRSILMEPGLHRESSLNEWSFQEPEKGTPYFHVWRRIEEFLEETESEPKSFAELNAELMAPPYGVKAGVLPILYIAVYCVYQRELAIYESRQYRPVFSKDMLERFVKRPDEFTVQRFRIVGMRASIYEEYKTLFTDGEEKSVIQLVRPLADLIGSLAGYTQKTRSSELSDAALRVRDAFKLARSPEKLLFEDLPNALGYGAEIENEVGDLRGYSEALQESLRELKYAYPNLIKHEKKLLAHAFHIDEDLSIAEFRKTAIGRFEGLEQYTVDIDGLRALIKRITKKSGSDDEWLENILMFLGQKPSSKWTDTDRAEAEVKLSDYAKRVLDLRTLRLHYDKSAEKYEGEFEVILLKTLKRGEEPVEEVVAIDQVRHEAIKAVKDEIRASLDQHKDRELKLAILAEVVDEYLGEYRANKQSAKDGTPTVKGRAVRVK